MDDFLEVHAHIGGTCPHAQHECLVHGSGQKATSALSIPEYQQKGS